MKKYFLFNRNPPALRGQSFRTGAGEVYISGCGT